MKLAYLLAQYLYTNKRLDLPGIGTFLLDPSVLIDTENNKHRNATPEGISFENNPSIQNAPDLVSYISSKSGKMRPLAESDLESHLQIAQQFLNISKPFTFEGIGTLVKNRPGEFEFTPGNIIPDRLKDHPEKEVHGLTKKETVDAKYQAYLSEPVVKSPWRKPVIALLILCGIALAIWGGYTISTRQAGQTEVTASETIAPTPQPLDPLQSNKVDSTTIQKTDPTQANYKYVLEITKAPKVFKRYQQLKDTDLKLKDAKLKDVVQMETTDSIKYKLFVLLPVTTDTTTTLMALTGFLGKKVYIERQN